MKVVAFNGSPRKNGNTSILMNYVLDELSKESIETKLVQVGGHSIRGCAACYTCKKRQDKRCVINDIINTCIEHMLDADGIIIGSPTYFSDLTAETKALIDRAGVVSRTNGHLLKNKVGASITAVRRVGSIHVLDSINHFFSVNQMIIPGSTYWNVGVGKDIGDVINDEEGVETMQNLGKNMAWLLHKLHE